MKLSTLYRAFCDTSEKHATTTHLILYIDLCGGQNKDVFILSLLRIVASPYFTLLEVIHQICMVSDHSYLPNNRNFSNIETATQKSQHLFVSDDWHNVVRNARHTNVFNVTPIGRCDFVSLKGLKKAFVSQKLNTQKHKG